MDHEVTKLADFAISQPQACYAAFTFGLRHRWTYFLRTLQDIAELLEPLERAINEVLIPAVTDHTVTKAERDLLGRAWEALDLQILYLPHLVNTRLQSKLLIRS